jgi:DNA-binding LacI/PurR family transcriptional regulator
MGEAAVRLVFEQLDASADVPPRQLRFPAELIVRGSVAAPRTA